LAKCLWHTGGVTSLDDVEQAFRAIERTRQQYRETLRAALADGVTQADVSRRLDRSREILRQDAMSDEELAAVREAELDRQRARRAQHAAS